MVGRSTIALFGSNFCLLRPIDVTGRKRRHPGNGRLKEYAESLLMQSPIKRLTRSTMRRLGYQPIGNGGFRSEVLSPFLSLLKALGFAPKHIIDIGANKGDWTRTAIEFFPEAHYTLIEPQDKLKSHIDDLIRDGYKIRWINAGAGDQAGSLRFTVAGRDDSSTFVMSQEEALAQGLHQEMVEVRTLNDIVATSNVPLPEMVKIDAEGFDLKVLSGASALLGKTEVFLAEAAICANLENTLAKMIQRMSELKYRLVDITDLNRSPRTGALWLCEVAFVRDESPLFRDISYE
jgi:FkbM family methyltransferase